MEGEDMDPDEIKDALKAMMGMGQDLPHPDDIPAYAKRLKASQASLAERHHLHPGDVVAWKPGLKNKKGPGPFIVVEVYPDPIFDDNKEGGSGNAYWHEPLDIVLGAIDRDGNLILHHYDSRRLQKLELSGDDA